MSSGAVILIVDDEIQIRRFLRITLEANGYHVYETETGQEALSKAAQLRPDLIILDLGLPDMDGLEVLLVCATGRKLPSLFCPSVMPTGIRWPRWTPVRMTI